MVPHPALGRAARDVVLDAVADERPDAPVVHADRDGNLDRLLALREHGDEVVVDAERVGDETQLLARDRERVLAQMRGFGWCESAHEQILLAGPTLVLDSIPGYRRGYAIL